MDTLNKLRALFGKHEKKKFLGLFGLMIISALFETLGIGLIVPFVGILTNPKMIFENNLLSSVYNSLGFQSTQSFLIMVTIGLLVIFIMKNLYLLWFCQLQYKVIYNEQVKMSERLLTAYMMMPYIFHLHRNSAQLVRNTNYEVQKVFYIISSVFIFLTEILVILCILILLLTLSPLATILSAVLLGVSVGLFMKVFKNKISKAGKEQQRTQGNMIKWVNQGLGAGKEVKVLGREFFFVNAYTKESKIYANAARFNTLILQIPRFYIETVVVATLLTFILVIILQSQDLSTLLSTTSVFAMAAFRLMPSINRILGAVSGMRSNKPGLDVVYNDLIVEKVEKDIGEIEFENMRILINPNEKTFKNCIEICKINFKYHNAHEDAIKDVSLSIPIGKSVAFIGQSGSGKTTLVDIILGVLDPYQGSIMVDGKELSGIKQIWRKKIGYIPQFIYLSDDTIRSNVAFGLQGEDIDDNEVWRALEQAQLKKFVLSLPDKLETSVGESGVRLSGGQRQRIGIARALYHNPEILFMDEATSALDNETEKEIMKAIDGLKGEKTLIIIAHRLSTIENCDIVFEMDKGRIATINNKLNQLIR